MKILRRPIVKLLSLLLAAGLSSPLVRAAKIENTFLLQTKQTTMAFRHTGDSWSLLYYGPRLENGDDIAEISLNGKGGNLGSPTLTAYGSAQKFGGLAVVHADGITSTELTAVSAETVADAAGTEHLVFELKDAVYPFFAKQHFRAVAASDVIETWVELRHDETAPVRLVRMNSLAVSFPSLAREFSVLSLAGQWAAEAQVAEAPLGLGQTVVLGTRSGVRSAFGSNPSFMLSIGPKASETTGMVLGGALAWSGAWEISLQRDQVNTLAIDAGPDTGNGAYLLEAGRTLTLPKMVLTYSNAGKGQVSRNFHRWARDVQLREGRTLRSVLLNSWEGAYFKFNEQTLTDMMDGVKQLGGEMFVVDDGWFGRGKFARDDDKRGLGDWFLNEAKLPRGLGYLAAQAESRGLKFGIWVEPEMANTTSELVEAHPDWVLREKTRPLRQGRGGTQVVLDLTNPAVRDNLFEQLDTLVGKTPGLAYIKWDANADIMNAGSTYLGADRQPNLWFDYTEGLYELLGRLHARHPALQVQACASGGGRMDYGFLRYADEFWTSDDTDARQRVFIQWGAGHFYPACAMAAHVTAVPNHQTHRSVPLKYRFDVAMSGRMGFELHPKNLSAEELAFAQKAVTTYKKIRPVVQQGDLYRLVSPWENSYASLMYAAEDKSQAVVFVYGLNRLIGADYPTPLRLQGLSPDKRYKTTELNREKAEHTNLDGKTVAGDALMKIGLPLRLQSEYDSAVFLLTEEK